MRVLSSLNARPLGASQVASRCLTCSACSRLTHNATRSSAYLTNTGAPRTDHPAQLPVEYLAAPAACSIPCRATFRSTGLITPPWGVPSSVGVNHPFSITPAVNHVATRSLPGNVPSWSSR